MARRRSRVLELGTVLMVPWWWARWSARWPRGLWAPRLDPLPTIHPHSLTKVFVGTRSAARDGDASVVVRCWPIVRLTGTAGEVLRVAE